MEALASPTPLERHDIEVFGDEEDQAVCSCGKLRVREPGSRNATLAAIHHHLAEAYENAVLAEAAAEEQTQYIVAP